MAKAAGPWRRAVGSRRRGADCSNRAGGGLPNRRAVHGDRLASMQVNGGGDIAIVLNGQAGNGRTPADAAALRAAFAAHGLQARVFACAPHEALDALLQAAVASRPAVLVAAGGD